MDNTLTDEHGSTLRPGIINFLDKLRSMDCELFLWTNSTEERARDILSHHKLTKYFSKTIFREDYDGENKGNRKDIRRINGEILIDDDPDEIVYVKKIGLKGFLIKSYRKGKKTNDNEYAEILKMISKEESFFKKLFG